MSETPRNDDEQFRDPTAPSYDAASSEGPPATEQGKEGGSTWAPSPPTEQVPTGSTQHLPSPRPGDVPPPPPQNPYASPPQPPAGQPGGYGPPPPGYGPPAPGYGQPVGYGAGQVPGYAAPRQMAGNTIALLVVGGLTTVFCGFGIVALVLGIIAATKTDQPAEQAKFTKWGWIAEVVGLVLVVVLVVLLVVVGMAGFMGSGSSTTF